MECGLWDHGTPREFAVVFVIVIIIILEDRVILVGVCREPGDGLSHLRVHLYDYSYDYCSSGRMGIFCLIKKK